MTRDHAADVAESRSEAQALCIRAEDFGRACGAFAARRKPVFEGR